MLVECIRLRMGGVKLRAEERAPPVRGHLRVELGTARVTSHPTSPPTVGDLVAPLEYCHLHRISSDDLVLLGVEPVGWPQRYGATQPQAWWCRIVRA